MLSESTAAQLNDRTYRADAKWRVCWLGVSGIYWEDEIPDITRTWLLPDGDKNQLLRLYGVRAQIWKGEALSDRDQEFWNEVRSQVPSWAFFQRLRVSADELQAQIDAERSSDDILEALVSVADEVSISEEDGVQSFSATWQVTRKDQESQPKQAWWKRVFRRKGSTAAQRG
jgi:hypothetical protein